MGFVPHRRGGLYVSRQQSAFFFATVVDLHSTRNWLDDVSLEDSATERHIWVNTGTKRSPYSVIFLARIACRYVQFELPADYLELAQAMLKGYFDRLEVG